VKLNKFPGGRIMLEIEDFSFIIRLSVLKNMKRRDFLKTTGMGIAAITLYG
jgi:hypothetical protein